MITASIRILLAQIATFEQQHRAGLNPPCSALAEFFETAREARLDVEAIDRGLWPGALQGVRQADAVPAPAPVTKATFERVGDVRLPGGEVARFAKALLDALDRSTVTAVGAKRA